MPGWFDIYDWPIGVSARDDPDGLAKAVAQIREAVSDLVKEGIPKSRIVVGGFSQGGAIALLAAYHENEEPFAGCVALSGWLTLADELQVSDGSKNTPLFWAHGQYDDKVLFEQQPFGLDKLREKGIANIQSENYPMGHESHPAEMQAVAEFLDKLLFAAE